MNLVSADHYRSRDKRGGPRTYCAADLKNNIIRMKSRLRCATRFARSISDGRRRRKRSRIFFKTSNAGTFEQGTLPFTSFAPGLAKHLRRKRVRRDAGSLLEHTRILETYQSGDSINITRGKTFCDVIATLFAKPKERGVESALGRKC